MSRIATRIADLGLVLPATMKLPEGMILPFPWVNVRGDRAWVSGHSAQNADGTLAGPFGRLGEDVTLEQGYAAARQTALSMLGSLERELGDLDRVTGWGSVLGMVHSAPGFGDQPAVINGFSDLILDLFGPTIGRHARSAVGMAALPMGFCVEIEADLLIAP